MDIRGGDSKQFLYIKMERTKIYQLDFKREIVNIYLKRYQSITKSTERSSTSIFLTDCRISELIRFDQVEHLVKQTE